MVESKKMSFIKDQDSAIVLSSTMRYCPPCTSPFDSMWPALLFEQKLLLGTLGNCIHNDPPASTRRPMISRSLIPRKTSLLMARSFSNRPLLWSSAALKKQKQQKNKCPKRPPSTLPPGPQSAILLGKRKWRRSRRVPVGNLKRACRWK